MPFAPGGVRHLGYSTLLRADISWKPLSLLVRWDVVVPSYSKLPELLHGNFGLDENCGGDSDWVKDYCDLTENSMFIGQFRRP